MAGLHIDSFSLKNAPGWVCVLVYYVSVIGFSAPIAYLTYYCFFGGIGNELQSTLAAYAIADFHADVAASIARGDYRALALADSEESFVPGLGKSLDLESGVRLIGRLDHAAGKTQQERLALRYMEQYNRAIIDEYSRYVSSLPPSQRPRPRMSIF